MNIVLLSGGYTERDVSLMSSKEVKNSLLRIGHKVTEIDIINNEFLNHPLNKFDLVVNSERKKITSTKDKKGNPELLTIIISVKVQIIKNDVIKNEKIFSQNFSYANDSNKFSLAQYEKDIEKNLINKITENIKTYLLSL